jgi:Cu/Ag efflux pump CusA
MAAMRATPRAAEGVLGYFARHPTVANLLLVVLVVLGLAAAPQMRAQFFPDVIVDEVVVSVGWQGAGAEDVDAAIVQLLEPALLAVGGSAKPRPWRARGRRRSPSNSSPAGTWPGRPTM